MGALIGVLASVGGSGLAAVATPTPVAAAMSCANNNTCNWTQSWNGNWQPNSGQDPSCHSQCDRWWQDCRNTLSYYNAYTDANVARMADWAQDQWNVVKECTPTFNKTSNSGAANVQMSSRDMGYPGWCGESVEYDYQSSTSSEVYWISSAVINLNSRYVYYDGPPPSGAPANSCDMRNTLLHEVGHQYGEGHSSVPSDIMDPSADKAEAIDGDAHQELATVYGTSAPSCPNCQYFFNLPQVVAVSPADFVGDLTRRVFAAARLVEENEADVPNFSTNTYDILTCAPHTVQPGGCAAGRAPTHP